MWREAIIMVLYVCIVEIAELAALPEAHYADGRVSGPVDVELLALLWGTALGLAITHWVAFDIAAAAFHGGRPSRLDVWVGLGQFAGAAFVAALCSVPVLLLSGLQEQEYTGYGPSAVLGGVSFLIARHAGASFRHAVLYGVLSLALGVAVAAIKARLVAH